MSKKRSKTKSNNDRRIAEKFKQLQDGRINPEKARFAKQRKREAEKRKLGVNTKYLSTPFFDRPWL